MIVGHIGGSSSGGYEIQKSLRFRASASAYLSRTPTVAGNRKTWTWSGWVKRGALGANQQLFIAGTGGNARTFLAFTTANVLEFYSAATTQTAGYATTAVLRDPSAHYHIFIAVDTTQAAASDRVKIWVNGVSQALTTTWTVSQNAQLYINNNQTHAIGYEVWSPVNYLDGYLSEINFIDGQALGPEYFGEFSAETGSWIPKKYTGTYGTNGFYLPFNDGSTLANLTADRSGNGNNWTANNFSLISGSSYDWMDDTPTNNFAVLNAVNAGRSTLTNGNLTASGTTDLPTIIPDSGTWYFERGGVSQTWTPPAAFPSGSGDYNFGQRPFAYSPPAGFKALCTKNLPTPSILNPKKHFDVVLATGANIKSTAEAVFPGNFLEWIKDRGNANNHQLIDTVRGTSAVLQSNTTGAETTYSAPSGSSVGWTWKAGGAPVTNNAGSIQSQVSANPQAGFSIVTYTGTGANATVGHGLGVTPSMIIVKNRDALNVWRVGHSSLTDWGYQLILNDTNAQALNATIFNSTAPTSAVFSLGSSVTTNQNTKSHVAYCFAEVPGFSKIGSYVGNGNTDGPFVYCGFRPRWVMWKRTNAVGSWIVIDTARDVYNVSANYLVPNSSGAEASLALIDVTANGFKFRDGTAGNNGNGDTHIFIAFAEAPFNFAHAR